ncbi:MAG TPA: RNA-binding cell elongation regulator Jag/EloR [Anaerolineales bacterium]|nr:RNA-binding cell elongation regulator Jag/EloR [Anaerolineales bacterium]
MSERTTLEVIAPTVEEALAQGLAQLGLQADAVSVEVMDAGNKGLFGLGGRQVRVRLTVNSPDDVPASKTESVPASEKDPKPAPVISKVLATEVPAAPAVEGHDPLLDKTEAVISKMLHILNMQAQVSAHYDDQDSEDHRTVHVDVRGEDLGTLIGRHAETLNAFQYVAALIVGKETQQWVQLVVDVEGYRSRRERQLRQLARRMAEQVIKTGRRASLEPMSSSERRIVHLELRGHPAVMTESTGEEPHRKVVIIPKDS